MIYPNSSTYGAIDADEAMARAKEAVRRLSKDLLAEDPVIVSTVTRDHARPCSFPNQAAFNNIAQNAGFVAQVEVHPDRRGYVHQLVFRRTLVSQQEIQKAGSIALR